MTRYMLLLFLGFTLTGCDGAKDASNGTVKGRLTLSGKPLPNTTVVFDNASAGVARAASTDEDGRYEFTSHDSVGLPAASYKVTVSSGRFMKPGEEVPKFDFAKKPSGAPAKPPTPIPDKYGKAGTTPLAADVKVGDNPPFDFDLMP